MKRTFEVISIPRNTFGTKLKFEVYDSNNNNEALSAYSSVILRAFNPRNEEVFSGNVDESLSGVINTIHYTFKEGDLGILGIYRIYLDLIKKTGAIITYKNTIESGAIKVE